MQVLKNAQIVDMDGQVVREQVPTGEKNLMGQPVMKDGNVMTVGSVAINALLLSYEDEARTITGDEKVTRMHLALKIKRDQDPINMTAEEISLVKKLVGKAYGPMIVGQVWDLLEGPKPVSVKAGSPKR
jgi:hypothetical protein